MQLLFVNRDTGKHTSEISDANIRHDIWSQGRIDGQLIFENDILLIKSKLYLVRFSYEEFEFYLHTMLDGDNLNFSESELKIAVKVGDLWNGIRKDISISQ